MNPLRALLLLRALPLTLPFALLGAAPASAQSTPTQRWECSGAGWRGGDHAGTAAIGSDLVLPAGSAGGSWSVDLPEVAPFDRLLLTLNHAPLAEGDEVRARVRLHVDGVWTGWLPLGIYGTGPRLPRSERSSPSHGVLVKTDVVHSRRPATAAQVLLELRGVALERPRVRSLTVSRWMRGPPNPALPGRSPAWGRELREVPRRSQRVEDPAIAGKVCSPTSLGMVLAFHGEDLSTADVARGVFDHAAQIYGNWAFNVAFAGTRGLVASARHCDGFADLEAEIDAGRPVVISHRYARGELTGAPIESSEGHLIVVVGFTQGGDPIVHDPAARPGDIRRVYARDEILRSWLVGGEGIAYFVRRP